MNRKLVLAGLAAAIIGSIAYASASNASAGAFVPLASTTVKAAATTTDAGLYNGNYIDCVVPTSTSPLYHVPQVPNPGSGGVCPAGWPRRVIPATALKGDKGDTGVKGDTGATGATGAAGMNAQALPYGIALVNVSRGGAAASTWATFSTTLGSPAAMGDNASGVVRFSCSDAQAPCKISAQAYTDAAGYSVYPRLDITNQTLSSEAVSSCEYADGTDNNGGSIAVGTVAASPTALTLGIGGTLDCSGGQTFPANGVASDIWVPAGHYDVEATFYFKKS